jgi:hypothetical protein
MIIEKLNIFPLIIDTDIYRDRFGSSNRFNEMNPSIHINPSGEYVILVRAVNYLKYKDKSFQVYGVASESKYYITRGQFTQNSSINVDNCIWCPLEVNYNIPKQPSLWRGVEDIRFVNETTVLACIPECNDGRPGIFKGALNGACLTDFVKCEPSQTEKNWMPYSETDVVYIHLVLKILYLIHR